MRRLFPAALWLAWLYVCALGVYETTAKAPALLGRLLPGRQACLRAELLTRWDPRLGFLPADKLVHETQEALCFYGLRHPERTRRPASAPRSTVAAVLQVPQQGQVGLVAPHR